MKKFLNNNKKTILAVLISVVATTSITVFATSQYFADQISFTPSEKNKEKGFTATNVGGALNQLYEMKNSNTDLSNISVYKHIASNYACNACSISIDLGNIEPGTYLLETFRNVIGAANDGQTRDSNDITFKINVDGEVTYLGKYLYLVKINIENKLTIDTITSYNAKDKGGYLYGTLYKI